jgi:hypothetical protein
MLHIKTQGVIPGSLFNDHNYDILAIIILAFILIKGFK